MKRKWLAIGIILLFVTTSIIPSTAQDTEKPLPTTRGSWLYVGGSGPGNYTRIQDAINDAYAGDTIFVFDDSSPYKESLSIQKSIFLIGENNATTILDSNGKQMNFFIFETKDIVIQGFTFINNFDESYGADIAFVDNVTFADNIIIDCFYGIHIAYSSSCTLTDNEIRGGYKGITIYRSDSCSCTGNKLIDCKCGMDISDYSTNNNITGNTFLNCGLSISGSNLGNSYEDNTINGKPLLYLENQHNLIFESPILGQIYLVGCSNVSIRNVTLSNSTNGIKLINSNGCSLSYCHIYSQCFYGIVIEGESNNNTILENTIESNSFGLNIETYYISHSNSIIGNKIRFNSEGIILNYEYQCVIRNNIIENNENGLSLILSNRNLIVKNSITNNHGDGLALYNSPINIIKSNNLIDNGRNAYFEKNILGNVFLRNYWSPSLKIGPKVIMGKQIIMIWTSPYPGSIEIPWPNFDWFPALKPYDTPGLR